jgi:prevent-host-death family protein
MREVGVRDLKRSRSEILRAVERGEQIRVTVRGRAVADIVPAGAAPRDDQMRALVADGRLTSPSAGRPKRAPRLATSARTALMLPPRDLTMAVWDGRLHAAARAEGIDVLPRTLG